MQANVSSTVATAGQHNRLQPPRKPRRRRIPLSSRETFPFARRLGEHSGASRRQRDRAAEESADEFCPDAYRRLTAEDLIHVTKREKRTLFFKLNFAGTGVQINKFTVLRRPGDTRLHEFVMAETNEQRMQLADAYIVATGEYFFERSLNTFMLVFFLVSCYKFSSFNSFQNYCVAETASERLIVEHTAVRRTQRMVILCFPADNFRDISDNFDKSNRRLWTFRQTLWDLFEAPNTSLAAYCISVLSLVLIGISVANMSLSTMKRFQSSNGRPWPIFGYVELVCILWFTIEYLVKVVTATDIVHVMTKPIHLIDAVAIVPFYVEWALTLFGVDIDSEQFQGVQTTALLARIPRVLRIVRVVRVFKLGRHSRGLQQFGKALVTAAPRLFTYGVVVFMLMLFFAATVFHIEHDAVDGHPKFRSIPDAMWWCFVAMTAVGYGDIVPTSTLGRIVASIGLSFGLMVIALPITILVDQFWAFDQTRKRTRRAPR